MIAIPLQAPAGGSTPQGHVILYRAGYFQKRLIKGGVFVAVRLWQGFGKADGREISDGRDPALPAGQPNPLIARGWQWRAMLDGVEVHPWRVWPDCSGDEISEAEYRYLLARRDHATKYDSGSPFASPRQKVDWLTVKHDFSDLKGPQT